MRTAILFLISTGINLLPLHATPERCLALRQDFTKRMEAWATSLKQTTSTEAQKTIWQQRPDAMATAAKLWSILQPQLAQPWTLDHTGWLLKLVCAEQIDPKQAEKVQLRKGIVTQVSQAVMQKHWRSEKLAPVCLGLLAVGDQEALKILEKIEANNPSRRVQGVAAICISYLIGNISDAPDIMKRRLTLLRKAIIESHDVNVDGVTMAQLAEDQLYVIRYLCKGRQAPELATTDQSGVTRKLSSYQGKVVILLFWTETMDDAEHFLQMSSALKTKYAGKNLEILGVFHGSTEVLRRLHAEKLVNWTNLTDPDGALTKSYRIQQSPTAYVLDKAGTIQYIGNPGSFAELTADALIAQ